jgi:hypothetical protein
MVGIFHWLRSIRGGFGFFGAVHVGHMTQIQKHCLLHSRSVSRNNNVHPVYTVIAQNILYTDRCLLSMLAFTAGYALMHLNLMTGSLLQITAFSRLISRNKRQNCHHSYKSILHNHVDLTPSF